VPIYLSLFLYEGKALDGQHQPAKARFHDEFSQLTMASQFTPKIDVGMLGQGPAFSPPGASIG